MLTDGDKSYFIVDDHIGFWNAGPDNQANKYDAGFISCFYDFHKNLSPPEVVWPEEKFEVATEDQLVEELFDEGGTNVAIFQPAYPSDFFTEGFQKVSRLAEMAERYPGRLIANGRFDPREGDAGLKQLEHDITTYGLTGLKTYTAKWNGDSRGWKLSDPEAFRFMERAQDLGMDKIHVHKGPTIWPLSLDFFDVRDVDVAASAFPDITFVVEHCGLPRLDEFCWIAAQEPERDGRPDRRASVHPHAAELLRQAAARAAVLGRRGSHPVRLRLAVVEAELARAGVPRLRHGRGRGLRLSAADGVGQAQGPRPQLRQALRHRRARLAEQVDEQQPRDFVENLEETVA